VSDSVDVLLVASSIPAMAHPGDAGADLSASEACVILPGERRTVGTGVSIALPRGHVAFIVPRSGLAARHGLTIVNSPGTVDAGYRGEIFVTLLNTDMTQPFSIAVGDRIAQMVILPFVTANFVPVDHLPGSDRGEDGFGSTGVSSKTPRKDLL
jgi:dUTP pyrophosphatase